MRLGLLADIHEDVEHLRDAISSLQLACVDRFIILGDVTETGARLAETVAELTRVNAGGVWGNHDFGLCRDVSDELRRRYPPPVVDYFATLVPALEIGDCLFQHVEPYLNSESLADLWNYEAPDAPRAFAAAPHARIFVGHLHRWEAYTTAVKYAWAGEQPLQLDRDERYLIVVHAVQNGWCAWYDTDSDVLMPLKIG